MYNPTHDDPLPCLPLTSLRAAVLAGAGPFLHALPARAVAKGTAFALIGDRYHNSDYIRTGLGKTIGRDLDLPIDFCDEVKMLTEEHLKGYRLLIILRDGMTWPGGYPDENPTRRG